MQRSGIRLLLTIVMLIILLLAKDSSGQTISGKVIDQWKDAMSFANVILLDSTNRDSALTDPEGYFIFKHVSEIKNKKIYAIWGSCYSDTVAVTTNNRNKITLKIIYKKECKPKGEVSD